MSQTDDVAKWVIGGDAAVCGHAFLDKFANDGGHAHGAALCLVALVRVATAAPSDTTEAGVTSVIRKAVVSKTLAVDQEVRAAHDAFHATAWVHRGARHR